MYILYIFFIFDTTAPLICIFSQGKIPLDFYLNKIKKINPGLS